MSAFDGLPEQPRALRLLEAALAAPAHAYLLTGPAGSGKRRYADRFAAALLDCPPHRIESRTHPDLFVLEPEGQGILIEGARRLRRDLHLRPFEADRRVYLILDAHLLRDESANALLKSLEEPPAYGVFVLVSDHAERMLPTIRSRLQAVDFRRYPAAALEAVTGDAGGGAGGARQPRPGDRARDRPGRGRAPAAVPRARPRRLHRRGLRPRRRPAPRLLEASGQRARAEADAVGRERDARLESVDDPKDERALRKRYEERGKRESRRAEWDELRLAVDTIGLWYHDLLATALGAHEAVVNSDMAGGLSVATLERRGGSRSASAGHGCRRAPVARAERPSGTGRRGALPPPRPGPGIHHRRGCDGNRRRRRVPAGRRRCTRSIPPGSSCAGTSASSARRRAGASTAGWCRPPTTSPTRS